MTFDGGAKPQDCDERGKGVKTDRIDALALCQRLDRYTRGNLKAFSIVRVPTEDEERQRAFARQRGQIVRECPSLQLMGRRLRKLRASCSVLMIQFLPMHPWH